MSRVEQVSNKERVFSPLASVEMMAFDIRAYGMVLPETMQRVYDEELTFVAEAMLLPLRTDFSLEQIDGQIVYFDNGQWKPYITVFENGYRAASSEAQNDQRLLFNAERAEAEYREGLALESLQPGQSLVVFSPFPSEAFELVGAEIVKQKGYQPERKLGFIRLSQKNFDGSIRIISQSIDQADPKVLSEVMLRLGIDPPPTYSSDILSTQLLYESQVSIDSFLSTFDEVCAEQYGKKTVAGRSEMSEQDAWEFIAHQQDLSEYYFAELYNLAKSHSETSDLEEQKKILTLSYWSALRERLTYPVNDNNGDVGQEMRDAFDSAQARHEEMIGCGGKIGINNKLTNLTYEQAANSIFNAGASKLTWRKGKCRISNCPTRPATTLVADCSVCVGCQKLYDRGKDPQKIYKKQPRKNIDDNVIPPRPKPKISKPKQRGRSFWLGE